MVYVYRTEAIDDRLAIAMELVPGGTLKQKVQANGPLSWGETREAILRALDGLDEASRLGVLHRDFKPSNIVVGSRGETKVGDSGLSRPVDQVEQSRLTQTGRLPFEATNAVQPISQVLNGSPASPAELRDAGPWPHRATIGNLAGQSLAIVGARGVGLPPRRDGFAPGPYLHRIATPTPNPVLPMRVLVMSCVLGAALSAATSVAYAQCADGTPPPCVGRTYVRPVAAPLPNAQLRARRYLVLPFRNVTRQSDQEWLVEGSTTLLSEALSRWDGITVVSDERLYPALKRAGIAPGTIIEPVQVRKIAETTGGWTAVSGEILALGGKVRITARAWDVPTSRELVRAVSEVPATADVRVAYDSVGLRLLKAAGLDSATTDIAGTTTRNIEAYRAYARGLGRMRRSELDVAFTDFREAVAADSMFALAWARLAQTRSLLINRAAMACGCTTVFPKFAADDAARAAALSPALPARQRQFVQAIDAIARSQFGEARQLLETLVASDTTDRDALQQLIALEGYDVVHTGGPLVRPRGSRNRAALLAKRAIGLDPAWSEMYGVLATAYTQAAAPTPSFSIGMTGAPATTAEFESRRQLGLGMRFYYPVLRDSLVLIPVDSLAAIPSDSLLVWRKRARTIAKAWTERWIATAKDVAAPYQLLAQLQAWDGDGTGAARAHAKVDSLFGPGGRWTPRVWQMMLLARTGDLRTASGIADSLVAAGFAKAPRFAGENYALAWTLHLQLLTGKVAQADTVVQQAIEYVRPQLPSDISAAWLTMNVLMMSGSHDVEVGIPRAVRATVLDTVSRYFDAFARTSTLSRHLPYVVPILASNADSTGRRSPDVIALASRLRTAGDTAGAFAMLTQLVRSDSTAESAAAAVDWYREGMARENTAREARTARFTPRTAMVSEQEAVFEWAVRDDEPFVQFTSETPMRTSEYYWEVRLPVGPHEHRLLVQPRQKDVGQKPRSGSLADLLTPRTPKSVAIQVDGAGGRQTPVTLSVPILDQTFVTEVTPGLLRLKVKDRLLLDEWRRARPTEAIFEFGPCARTIGVIKGGSSCTGQRIPVVYR